MPQGVFIVWLVAIVCLRPSLSERRRDEGLINANYGGGVMGTTSLSIAIVVYNPDLGLLRSTIESVFLSLESVPDVEARVVVVDNSLKAESAQAIERSLVAYPVKIISGHGNVGFGRANNLLLDDCGDFHLVLNPDVVLSDDCLKSAISFMVSRPDCGLLSPGAFWPNGANQPLCKRYPTVLDLLLRGFAPGWVRARFKKRLMMYELSDVSPEVLYWDPPIVSGCFMFFRGQVWRDLGGFDSRFFLYFEDFDLSLRVRRFSRIASVPNVKIIHHGGGASRKGMRHILLFVRSAVMFFRKHGWRFF